MSSIMGLLVLEETESSALDLANVAIFILFTVYYHLQILINKHLTWSKCI